MSVFKVTKCIKCVLQRGISTFHLQNRRFTTFVPDYSKDQNNPEIRTVQDASKFLSTILRSCDNGSIFTGTGQYHQLKDQDRILVLNFSKNFLTDKSVSLFDTKPLLDCCVKHSDIDSLVEDVKLCSPLPVYNGEVDFIDSSPWQYGFILEPFSIFSGYERICMISGNSIYVSVNAQSEVIDINDVEYVGLWVSEEPYNEQSLLFKIKNKPSKELISVKRNNVDCDLAKLTEDTEWMMKTGALLCSNLTKRGNTNVHLRMSPALQPGNNEWVAMRQKIWIEMIHKNMMEKKD